MSLVKELEFLYESGMTEDDLIAQAMSNSISTATMDEEQTSARQDILKTEIETIESEKDATRALRTQQDIEFAESLRADREKDSVKFGKMIEEELSNVEKKDEYDFEWAEEANQSDELSIPATREQLREARLKFFLK